MNKENNKVLEFATEIRMIQRPDIQDFVCMCLKACPDYFFEMPASTTGKYHPWYTLGTGGLVRHTKAAVKIAEDLLNLEQNHNLDHDIIIAALILHDCVKKGPNGDQYTAFEHPLYSADLVILVANSMITDGMVDKEDVDEIIRLIRCHMGQWNTDRKSTTVLPKPSLEDEKFVHMCDYLASRKYLICDIYG